MYELMNLLPDHEVLLSLHPEELSGLVLRVLRERAEKGDRSINTYNLVLEIMEPNNPTINNRGYPSHVRKEVGAALSEAFAWLEGQALIVPEPGNSGNWKILSRRARAMETPDDFQKFVVARKLNRELIHPAISEEVWLSFVRGKFAQAVFEAMRAVEIAVREAAGLPEGDHGVPMIRRAFHKDTGKLTDPNQEEAEREALAHLFSGAVGSYKNPHSHRNVPMDDAGEAIEVIMLASHLLRIVDARKPK